MLWNDQQPSYQNQYSFNDPLQWRYLSGYQYMGQRIQKKSRLTTVSIGHNVSVIGKNAFYKCKKLKKVTIGTGLTQINPGAFRGVKKGCTITIKSLKLKRVSSRIDQSVSRMTVRVPKRKYTAYKKLLRKKSKSVIIKKY